MALIRPVCPALEEVLGRPFKVLDHGFVRVIDYMGDDHAIVQAARVSYGKGTKKVHEDEALIRYLMRHRHTTPFEMCEIKLHIKLPIFVARQWIRHRTASVNEYSARYSILDREVYIPQPEHLAAQSQSNGQGRQVQALPPDQAARVRDILIKDAAQAHTHYRWMLNEENDPDRQGLARELARMNLPANTYTQWYWKINLHNLLHFLSLRNDPHAQYEIKIYAEQIQQLVARWVPIVHRAFSDIRERGAHLSGPALEVVRRMLAGETIEQHNSGLSAREWRELTALLAARGT
ncbi:MAG: FAD-dependent thymidylate synthase [Pseudomonadota bacterium]